MQAGTPTNEMQRSSSQRAAKDKARAAIAGVSAKPSGHKQETEDLSTLTALRSLFRLLAAEQASQAHLPLPHSVMIMVVRHLQPQCALAQSSMSCSCLQLNGALEL
jgi:hypothetical protein